MIEANDILLIISGIFIGFLCCYFIMLRANSKLKNSLIVYQTRQSIENELNEQSKSNEAELMQRFRDSFSALSSQALRDNNEEFLKLARENFNKQHNTAELRLNEKEKAFGEMVSPIKDILKQTDEQLKKLEADRQQTYGSISQFYKI